MIKGTHTLEDVLGFGAVVSQSNDEALIVTVDDKCFRLWIGNHKGLYELVEEKRIVGISGGLAKLSMRFLAGKGHAIIEKYLIATCEHGDMEEGQCLDCGLDCREELAARAESLYEDR